MMRIGVECVQDIRNSADRKVEGFATLIPKVYSCGARPSMRTRAHRHQCERDVVRYPDEVGVEYRKKK